MTIADMQKQLEILSGAAQGISGLGTQMGQLQTAIGNLKEAVSGLAKGSSALSEGVSAYTEAVSGISEGAAALSEGFGTYSSGGQSLSEGYSSMLSGISLDVPKHAIGRNTVEAMRSGLVYGHAAIIDGLLERMEEEMGEPMTAIATGGLAASVVPVCRHEIILDKTLLLTGLQAIYEKNVQPVRDHKTDAS